MSDDDMFDKIVNNQPGDDGDGEGEDQELRNIWEGIEHIWPHFYPGILVKGVILAEYIDPDGDRVMRFISSPDMTPWELLGLIESARLDAREISQCASMADPLSSPDEDEE